MLQITLFLRYFDIERVASSFKILFLAYCYALNYSLYKRTERPRRTAYKRGYFSCKRAYTMNCLSSGLFVVSLFETTIHRLFSKALLRLELISKPYVIARSGATWQSLVNASSHTREIPRFARNDKPSRLVLL